ncbi:MAG: hypothetical protein IKQ15_08370 [Kiritimatiellae bacterium]|nr:hypothetical protein [Kiritimatiellia bacterium]
MSDEKKNQDIEIADTGSELTIRVGGEAYAGLRRTEAEFPGLGDDKRGMAALAAMTVSAVLSKQLVEEIGGVVEEAPSAAQDAPEPRA